jgi:hypothetical protein
MEKIVMCHEKLKWKSEIFIFEVKKLKIFIFEIWNENFWKYSFLKFEIKISIWNLKTYGHITVGKWKKIEMKKSYISFMAPR